MSDLSVTAKITGLDDDIEKEVGRIKGKIPQALRYVGNQMIDALQDHISRDVYAQYSPTVYKRRSENAGYGTPLNSDENMHIQVQDETLDFSYTPTGKHKQDEWSVRHGDDLIDWLQAEHPSDEFTSRPFWNRFVDELQDDAIEYFIAGMSLGNPKWVVTREPNEMVDLSTAKRTIGSYKSDYISDDDGEQESFINNDDDDGDGKLPF